MKYKDKGLIRLSKEDYLSLSALLEDIFYRDKVKRLAPAALTFLEKVHKNDGLSSRDWQFHVADLFKCKPIEPGDEKALDILCQKYLNLNRADKIASKSSLRGKKPYQALLERHKRGELQLSQAEIGLLEKINTWHSAISSYYSMINKLRAMGFIEKKKSLYIKSSKFQEKLKQMDLLLGAFEEKIKEKN